MAYDEIADLILELTIVKWSFHLKGCVQQGKINNLI